MTRRKHRHWLPIIVLALLLGAALWYFTEEYGAMREGSRSFADSSEYQGQIRHGRLHGHGILEWPNGARYEGEFSRGLFSGPGRYRDGAGNEHAGRYAQGLANGPGGLEFVDGGVYQGEFLDGHMHGQGVYKAADGDEYHGDFVLGRFDGYGEYRDAAGSHYTGEFSLGRLHGEGIYTKSNGDVYRGEFDRGRPHGQGEYSFAANGHVYTGEFVNSEFTGDGTHTDAQGNRYSGEFRNWLYLGSGQMVTAAGDIYEGEFIDGALQGSGRHIAHDGGRYLGEFRNWLYSGRGMHTDADGNVYEGEFEAGLYHGNGTLSLADPVDGRTELRGEWRYGEYADAIAPVLEPGYAAAMEQALYVQQSRLQEVLAGLQAGHPGRINLYFLAVAGDGTQEVFRREVEFIRDQFDRDFDTGGRSMALINSRRSYNQYPLATATGIEQSLHAISRKMDPEHDILFLYLTSHGSESHELVIEMPGMDLPDLAAARLRDILAALPIRWKVIVVSACYSGGFIDYLRDDHTLIMTAARHDRHSFGCSDDSEMTYFGRALFRESLPRSRSFTEAFESARVLIREWEAEYDNKSLPQIHAPAPVLEHLQSWAQQSGLFAH